MKLIKTANGKKQLKISQKEWESIGIKVGWVKESQADWGPQVEETGGIEGGTVMKGTPNRIENLKSIANFMIENCPRGEDKLMHTLNGYGEQILIIADELEKKLELTNFRLEEKPEGWQ